MKINKTFNNNVIVLGILGLLILLPLIYFVVFGASTDSPQPFLEKPKGEEKCVRDTKYMRYNHMILLKEIRNEALREGKKTDIGLNKCRVCHTNREKFCDKCHTIVNLNPDCYRCHYYPTK